MRVLLVESDASCAQSLELMLKSDGIRVETTDLGDEALDLAAVYEYDLILSEVNLSDMSGISMLQALRKRKDGTPVLFLSGDHTMSTKLRAFESGADGYIEKPFHKDFLMANTLAIIRRTRGYATPIVHVGEISVDMQKKIVHLRGRPLHLTGKEYDMLELLVLRRGHLVTKEMFLNHLYGGRDEPEMKIVDVFICKLRKKLLDHGTLVETVWGRGYTLQTRLEDAGDAPAAAAS